MGRKKQVSADDILKQMYPDLATSDDIFPQPGDDPKPEPKNDVNQTIADLQSQIAQLTGTLEGYTRGKPVEQPVQRGQAPQRPQPIQLPDPALDPEGYRNAVLASTQQLIDYEKQVWGWQQQQGQSAAARSAGLWNSFTEKYSAYAGDEERVEIATSRIIQRAAARGLDTERLMYGDQDAFMRQVAGEYDKLFGKPETDDDEGDEIDDDVSDNRSTVMGAGAPAPRGGPANVQQPANPFGALSQEVIAWQGKTGYSR